MISFDVESPTGVKRFVWRVDFKLANESKKLQSDQKDLFVVSNVKQKRKEILLAQWLILYRQIVGNSNQTTNTNLYRPWIYLHQSLLMNISWGMQTYATIKRRFLSSSSTWKKRRKKTKDEVPNHNTDYNRPQITSHIYY